MTVNPPGCVGQYLHGGGFDEPARFTTAARPHTSMCNYAWQVIPSSSYTHIVLNMVCFLVY